MPIIRPITASLAMLAALASFTPLPAIADPANPIGGYDHPAGNYKSTCDSEEIIWYGLYLKARCRSKSGKWGPTGIAFHRCITGTIRNNDGKLECDPDVNWDAKDQALTAAAKPAFDAGSILVLGLTREPDYNNWIWKMRLDGSPYQNAVGTKSLDFTQVVKFLRSELPSMGKSTWDAIIDRAFQQVYKRAATAAERSLYEAKVANGTMWYAAIVTAERTKKG